MTKKVILTPVALANYRQVIEYLLESWSKKVAEDFIRLFETKTNRLGENPQIYPFINERQSIRRCILTKHNIIYFKETEATVKILMVFDTRQDASKLTRLL